VMALPAPISINPFAAKGQVEVDPKVLRARLVKLNPGRAVIYGHLLPHVLKRSEATIVAVLRCEPSVLRKRLAKRRYPPAKVTENVEAELIGVVLDECVRKFGAGRVREYDTTSASPKRVAAQIARDAKAAMVKPPKAAASEREAWIDWTLDYGSSTKLRSLLAG
jgi:broad-specificity NMP kinase